MERKANDTQTKIQKEKTGRNHGAHFTGVCDSRNRKIRGLWQRNGRYYAQFRVPGEKSPRRVPLTKNEGGDVEDRDDAPKKLTTVRKEELILALWAKHIGNITIDRITQGHVTTYLEKILEAGTKKRTRNIHLSILRNILNHFADNGIISHDLPTAGVKLLKHKTPKRAFLSSDQLNSLISSALLTKEDGKSPLFMNGQELADLIRLHDLRHYFASRCVMAGIDYMTIAAWLGHQDGGILIGKVYGRLADEHKKQQAEKLALSGPRIVPLPKQEGKTSTQTAAASA